MPTVGRITSAKRTPSEYASYCNTRLSTDTFHRQQTSCSIAARAGTSTIAGTSGIAEAPATIDSTSAAVMRLAAGKLATAKQW
jgi:hypothetical protein